MSGKEFLEMHGILPFIVVKEKCDFDLCEETEITVVLYDEKNYKFFSLCKGHTKDYFFEVNLEARR